MCIRDRKETNKYTDYFGKDIFDVVISMKDKFHTSNITASPKYSLANSLISSDILFRVCLLYTSIPFVIIGIRNIKGKKIDKSRGVG